MFFKKSDRKSTSPMLVLTVGALAMVGAFSIVKCGKRMMKCGCDKMTGMVKHMMGKDACDSGCE